MQDQWVQYTTTYYVGQICEQPAQREEGRGKQQTSSFFLITRVIPYAAQTNSVSGEN